MTDVHALSGAYAVDALDHEERARFEAHLPGCPSCREEVADFVATAGLLAATVEESPPAGLRDRVLADISTVRPLPPRAAAGQDARTSAAPRRTRGRWLAAVAAAAVLVTGVGAAITQPWEEESSQVQPSLAERVLAADDARKVEVSMGDGSKATVTRSLEEGRAVIETHDMRRAPSGRVYQVWMAMPDGQMHSAGLMPNDPDATMVLDGDATDATAIGITVEPTGGSAKPTSEPMAMIDLTKAT